MLWPGSQGPRARPTARPQQAAAVAQRANLPGGGININHVGLPKRATYLGYGLERVGRGAYHGHVPRGA